MLPAADISLLAPAYALAAFGLWYVVGRARVSRWSRERLYGGGPARRWLVELLECPACFGYWTGSLLGAPAAAVLLSVPPSVAGWVLYSLALACFTVATNLILFAATRTALDSLDSPVDPTDTRKD